MQRRRPLSSFFIKSTSATARLDNSLIYPFLSILLRYLHRASSSSYNIVNRGLYSSNFLLSSYIL